MGYRTTIQNINSVGHLIEGNVYTFLQQSVSTEEMFRTNTEFLDNLISRTSENFYMSEEYWKDLYKDLEFLRYEWPKIRREWKYSREHWEQLNYMFNDDKDLFLNLYERILDFLQNISKLFSRCKIKAILLPGFDSENPLNSFLTSKNVLERLVEIHPGGTALIIHSEEIFNK